VAAEAVVLGDWGGTTLRLWLRQAGATLAVGEAPGLLVALAGPAAILRAALARLGAPARPRRIVLCGMAGARGGLAEAGYVSCPAGVPEWIAASRTTVLDDIPVALLPGFSDRRGRPDVMRGEETQVFGALTGRDAREPVDLVLPGTHSKWVRVQDDRIVRLATCPTGELHARLLGSSLAPAAAGTDDLGHAAGFAAGVDRALDGGPLIASLFEARAAQVLDGRTGDWSRGFLSGLLIGAEVAAMAPSLGSADAPLLVGSDALVRLYRSAFARFGLDCRAASGESCALAGLEIADAQLG
jgi:2-dehydro-3-deoxygalactonokinase